MRYIISSIGRAANMVTLESLPESCLPFIDLYVMESEYKEYSQQWYASKVRKIFPLPAIMDCLSKKKKFFYRTIKGPYILIDDDLFLFSWSVKEQRFVKAKEAPRPFTSRFLGELPELFELFNMVSCAQRTMSSTTAAKKSKVSVNRIGSAMAGYAATRPQDIWFNKILFTLDQPIPLQNFQRTKSSCEYTGIAFNQSWAKALSTSGTASQRNLFLAMNDALKCVQLFPGIVTDFVSNSTIKGGLAIHRKPSRVYRGGGIKDHHLRESSKFLDRFVEVNALKALPKIFDYEDDQPYEHIKDSVYSNWKKVGGKVDQFTLPEQIC